LFVYGGYGKSWLCAARNAASDVTNGGIAARLFSDSSSQVTGAAVCWYCQRTPVAARHAYSDALEAARQVCGFKAKVNSCTVMQRFSQQRRVCQVYGGRRLQRVSHLLAGFLSIVPTTLKDLRSATVASETFILRLLQDSKFDNKWKITIIIINGSDIVRKQQSATYFFHRSQTALHSTVL
jgi:hypothetical protein